MIFSLEVIQAKHGDCLLLHYGSNEDPQFILIDGGPSGVYKKFLKPRLEEIKKVFSDDEALNIPLMMISHMDDDHVRGILDMTGEITTDLDEEKEPMFEIESAWFNSFDDIIGNIQIPNFSKIKTGASAANLDAIIPNIESFDHHNTAVLASTGQGRRLKLDIEALLSVVNNGNSLIYSEGKGNSINFDENLEIIIIHPNEKRLQKMQKKWDADLKLAKKKGDDSIIFASIAGDRDNSPFNLASIVCLVKSHGKTILLTGDARDDDILDGLTSHELLDNNGQLFVDILKIPHHGSDRNASRNFFSKVIAKNYIISGDGKHHNPEKSLLQMIEDGTEGITDDFTILFTNKKGKFDLEKKLDAFEKSKDDNGRNFKLEFLPEGDNSIVVDLLDQLAY
jgi:hypothetical protein